MRPARLAFVLATLGLTAGLLTPRTARADVEPQPDDDEVEIQIWILKDTVDPANYDENEDDNWREITPDSEDLDEFFNEAHCTCGTPVRLVLRKQTLTDYSGVAELWLGNDCNKPEDATRNDRCVSVLSFDPEDLRSRDVRKFITADQLMYPKSDCAQEDSKIQAIYVLIDQDGVVTTNEVESFVNVDIDTKPPPPVEDYKVQGAEAAVEITWNVSDTSVSDVWYYQAICSLNGAPIKPMSEEPEYDQTCGTTTPPPGPDAGVADAGTADAGADAAPDAAPVDAAVDARPPADASLAEQDAAPGMTGPLDPRFICGSVGAGASSLRISVPEDLVFGANDVVEVQLLVIDKHHNVTAMGVESARPVPVQDFWEVYEDQGGGAEGGFCFVATAAYGDYDHPSVLVLRDFRDNTLAHSAAGRAFIAWYYRNSPALADFIREHAAARLATRVLLWPVVILAGTWEYTTALDKLALLALLGFAIVRRRRRKLARAQAPRVIVEPSPLARRALAAAATTLLVLLCTAHVASAQAVYDDDLDETYGPARSQWIFELKFGPYTPAIDEELSGMPGPYEQTFGDENSFMTQLELDRYFLYPAGQLGVALGLGYMQNTAAAFKQNPDGTPDYSTRAPADDTAFHLIPVFVGAAYRFTKLADETVIPLVPYAKLGLSYYVWWITKGNGDLSATGDKGKARGGTLGWQGSLGLSLRADALDPGAARNLQSELGVEHAGFFAEVTYADVDGLGMERKLHVGDFTWFAGVNFEF